MNQEVTEAGWRLSEEDWRAWLADLVGSGRRVIAPATDGGLLLYRRVTSPAAISLEERSRWSPKEFLFPRTESLFSFELNGEQVELHAPQAEVGEQVLFGVRPCDAAGLSRLDDIFLDQPADELYAARRERTTVVSVACTQAGPACFCTAVGGSPSGTEGSDLQLVAIGEAWLLRILSPRGMELVGAAASAWASATPADWTQAERQCRSVEESMRRGGLGSDVPDRLASAFNQPLWDVVGERCLGCGICAYVCPSCSCFDVNDEANAYCGTRCRIWDTCTLAGFTKHASGHNPRPSQPARFRQRVLHKFAYFPLEHQNRFMCVGCGRCLELCPVGIDIHASVQHINAAARGTP